MRVESEARSAIKAVAYRALGTLGVTVVVYLYTANLAATLAVGVFDTFLNLALHFLVERPRLLKPSVVWFTGLSGSGKTTLCEALAERLRDRGFRVEHLDGDLLREAFPGTGFDRASREDHVKKVGFLASYLEKNGVFVLASLISPYEGSRGFVRGLCRNFVEVHVDTPLEECEKRDAKGLYARARSGELKHFTGIDDPYEAPKNPELRLNTAELSVEQAVERVWGRIAAQA
jgi:adenylylsulfate kinase